MLTSYYWQMAIVSSYTPRLPYCADREAWCHALIVCSGNMHTGRCVSYHEIGKAGRNLQGS
jgi:hypothetical protein